MTRPSVRFLGGQQHAETNLGYERRASTARSRAGSGRAHRLRTRRRNGSTKAPTLLRLALSRIPKVRTSTSLLANISPTRPPVSHCSVMNLRMSSSSTRGA